MTGSSESLASVEASAPSGHAPHATGHALLLEHKGKVGMASFLITEVAFFSTLIMAYITYIGADQKPGGPGGPTPQEVFAMELVLVSTACLLSSSITIHLAGMAHARGLANGFRLWLAVTIGLGAVFLAGTAIEWHDLIVNHGLKPWTNLFGSTYFTLVGFHALHVTIGLVVMIMLLSFSYLTGLPVLQPLDHELVAWYWHFVDGVWVVVFTVVYIVSRGV